MNWLMRRICFVILSLLLIPEAVLADVAFPLTFVMLPVFPFIVLVEALVFALLINTWLKASAEPKLIPAVFIANLITSLAGICFPALNSIFQTLLLAFSISVLVEWPVYIKILSSFKKLDLLKITFIANLASYTAVYCYFLLK